MLDSIVSIIIYLFSGSDQSRRHLAALEQSRQFADCVHAAQQDNRLSNEEDLFYSSLNARLTSSSSSSRLAIESNRNTASRLAIISPPSNAPMSIPIVNDTNQEDKSQSIINRQEQQSSTSQSQTSHPTQEEQEEDNDLSQRTLTQLIINDLQSNDGDDGVEDDVEVQKHPRASLTDKDVNMEHNPYYGLLSLRDYSDVTPKSPPSKLSLKRKLTYGDDNGDDDDSRNKETDSLPGKRSKFDEAKKGTISPMGYYYLWK